MVSITKEVKIGLYRQLVLNRIFEEKVLEHKNNHYVVQVWIIMILLMSLDTLIFNSLHRLSPASGFWPVRPEGRLLTIK